MKYVIISLLFLSSGKAFSQALVDEYIHRWKAFYPNEALRLGMHDMVYQFNESNGVIPWLNYNRLVYQALESDETPNIPGHQVNLRLLQSQVLHELHHWSKTRPHETSLDYYMGIINQALNRYKNIDFLNETEINHLRRKAYRSVATSGNQLIFQLDTIKDPSPERSFQRIQSTINGLQKEKESLENGVSSSTYSEGMISEIELGGRMHP